MKFQFNLVHFSVGIKSKDTKWNKKKKKSEWMRENGKLYEENAMILQMTF